MTDQATVRMNAEEFRQLPETTEVTELINGELIMPPSPMSTHQRLVRRIERFIEDHMPQGEVLFAPMDVYLDEVNVFQPDVFWLAENSQCVERDGYFYGAPELVVEVLSPATSTRDKREKFAIYERYGVKEYWIIDPDGKHVEVWQMREERFQRAGVVTDGESFHSSAFNKTVKLENIFNEA